MASKARKHAERRGRRAEFYAAWLLRVKGYTILDMRYKTKLGEIDIIARKKNVLAIVEVKQRASLQAGHAALHPASLRRIENAAEIYQTRAPELSNLDIRFDAIFILPRFRLLHLQDAWRTY